MRDGVLVVDQDNRIVFANPALTEIFSLPLAEIVNKRPLEAIRLVELDALIANVRQTGAPAEKEMKLLFPQEKQLLGLANPVEDKVAVIIRDITAIKMLENIRSEFVANVSHELKTPLTAIKSLNETLLHGAIDDPQYNRQFLTRIEQNVQNLTALIDDLLAISRLESHRGLAPLETVNLSVEVDKALETLSAQIKAKKIEIIRTGCPPECPIQGEPDHLYRALLNLLDNAVKFSPVNGQIEISCTKDERQLLLSVQDHGPGIAVEHQPRLFERFYRVDKARSRELGGTGLGLSIVKHIMEIHGGRVELVSQLGAGAKFTLIFPL